MQSAELYRADVNWLFGRKRIAISAAHRARQIAPEPLAIGFVGAFVRWGTILLLQENRPEAAWENLQKALPVLPRLDAMDRAEVLCAVRLVGTRIPIGADNIDFQTRECLALLPISCSTYLDRLGLLANRSSEALPKAALRA
jgi:hypothetical protein